VSTKRSVFASAEALPVLGLREHDPARKAALEPPGVLSIAAHGEPEDQPTATTGGAKAREYWPFYTKARSISRPGFQ